MTLPKYLCDKMEAAAEEYVVKMVTMNNRRPHRSDVLSSLFKEGWKACYQAVQSMAGESSSLQQYHRAHRYDEIHHAVEQMGGWANFRHWIKTHSVNYFNTCADLEGKLKFAIEALQTLKVAVNDKVEDKGATSFITGVLELIQPKPGEGNATK